MKFAFYLYLQVYDRSPQEPDVRANAMAGMLKTAESYEEWWLAYNRTEPGTTVREGAVARCLHGMMETCQTFGGWLHIFHGLPEESLLRESAIMALCAFAESVKDLDQESRKGARLPRWLKVLELSRPGSARESEALENIIREVRKNPPPPPRIRI